MFGEFMRIWEVGKSCDSALTQLASLWEWEWEWDLLSIAAGWHMLVYVTVDFTRETCFHEETYVVDIMTYTFTVHI